MLLHAVSIERAKPGFDCNGFSTVYFFCRRDPSPNARLESSRKKLSKLEKQEGSRQGLAALFERNRISAVTAIITPSAQQGMTWSQPDIWKDNNYSCKMGQQKDGLAMTCFFTSNNNHSCCH